MRRRAAGRIRNISGNKSNNNLKPNVTKLRELLSFWEETKEKAVDSSASCSPDERPNLRQVGGINVQVQAALLHRGWC